jgi:hypothetical protein
MLAETSPASRTCATFGPSTGARMPQQDHSYPRLESARVTARLWQEVFIGFRQGKNTIEVVREKATLQQ